MKKLIGLFMIVMAASIGLPSALSAHMMGGHGSQIMHADSTSTCQNGHMNMMGAMHNMSNNCTFGSTAGEVDTDFDKLNDHYNQMMKIDDINALKTELKKHHEMMLSLHDAVDGNVATQCSYAMPMMSWCSSPGMMMGHGMMLGNGMMGMYNCPNVAHQATDKESQDH
jgi:hypothetical protein